MQNNLEQFGIPFNVKHVNNKKIYLSRPKNIMTKLNKFDSTNVKLLSDKNRHGLELDNNKLHVHRWRTHNKFQDLTST